MVEWKLSKTRAESIFSDSPTLDLSANSDGCDYDSDFQDSSLDKLHWIMGTQVHALEMILLVDRDYGLQDSSGGNLNSLFEKKISARISDDTI